jgi:hypothetical protein
MSKSVASKTMLASSTFYFRNVAATANMLRRWDGLAPRRDWVRRL